MKIIVLVDEKDVDQVATEWFQRLMGAQGFTLRTDKDSWTSSVEPRPVEVYVTSDFASAVRALLPSEDGAM